MSERVLVIGGGVAGISAAVHLAAGGAKPLLLEQRRLLGGRAGSFASDLGPEGLIDNCQHVLLGCCSELQSLYKRLGVEDLIQFDDTIHFYDVRGRTARMKAAPLPAPLHLGPSLSAFGILSLRQKIEIVRGMMSIFLAGRHGRDERADISFEAYLRTIGQSESTIRDYWDVICVSALNEPCSNASAKYGMQVFQEGFLENRGGYQLGYARAPLTQLYQNLPGVEIRLGAQVASLVKESGRVMGVELVGGERIEASHVVLAVGPSAAASLLKPVMMLDPQLARISQIQFRPILGAHLLYDRPVPLENPIALVGTKMHWLFPDMQKPELVHGVVSAADLLPTTDLPSLFDREVRQVLPALGDAKLVDSVIVKESRATFRPVPGVDSLRPTQRTAIPGLALAGDYTQTDWPSTMESAARSGHYAAKAVLATLAD